MPAAATGSASVRLIVLRHGPAEEQDPNRWPDDDRRPLLPDAVAGLRQGSTALVRLAAPFACIATSPADRAKATAELLAQAAPQGTRFETWEELGPGNPAEPILYRVRSVARPGETTVVVGHAPTLGELLGLALTGRPDPLVRLVRGGAACVEFGPDVRAGDGVLLWLFTRAQLGAVG